MGRYGCYLTLDRGMVCEIHLGIALGGWVWVYYLIVDRGVVCAIHLGVALN